MAAPFLFLRCFALAKSQAVTYISDLLFNPNLFGRFATLILALVATCHRWR